MATIHDVRNAASALAGSVAIPRSLKQPGKIYEAWLMLEIAATLKSLGLIKGARWEDGVSKSPRRAIFRGGPSPLWDDTKSPPPGFVKIFRNGAEYEIHNSVQFTGASDAKHEIDISIERHLKCQYFRDNGISYPPGLPLCGFELKFYKKALFNIGIVRQFVALTLDLALKNPSPVFPPSIFYYDPKGSMKRGSIDQSILHIFTSARSVSSDAIALARFYHSGVTRGFDADPLVSPSGRNPVLRVFCSRLSGYLR